MKGMEPAVREEAPPLIRLAKVLFLTVPDPFIVNMLSVAAPDWMPTSVKGLVPATCRAVAGVVVPMPSLLLVASQKKLLLF